MESSEVGLHKSMKRKEPNKSQSENRNISNCNESEQMKEPLVHLDEHIGHVTETTSKNRKVVPESSLGIDQQLSSPPKGNSVVILALNAVSEGMNKVQDTVEKDKIASKTTEEHKEVCAYQKKHKSDQRKKSVVERGSEKLSGTSITNCSDQNLSGQKERVDGRISTKSLVAAEVNQRVDRDTLCNIQSKDVQLNKSSEPASETAELLEEVCVQKKLRKKVQSKNKITNASKDDNVVQHIVEKERAASETADKNEEVCVQEKLKKNHSKRRKKSAVESGSEKLSETLVTKHCGQNMVEEKLDQVDEHFSIKSLAAVNARVDHVTLCNTTSMDVEINKSIEPASEISDKYEESYAFQPEYKSKEHSAGKEKKVQSKNKITNSSKDNNVVQDIVEKERAASETADKNEEVCVQEKLEKDHSKRRKKCAVESGSEDNKVPRTLVEKILDEKILTSVKTAKAIEVQKEVLPVNTNIEAALKSAEKYELSTGLADASHPNLMMQDTKRNMHSGQEDENMPMRGKNKVENALVEDDSNKNLLAENIDGEVSIPEVKKKKKKKHSGRVKKHQLESEKIDLSSTLVNHPSSQNRVEETLDMFGEKVSLSPSIIASEVIDNSSENGDVQLSKGNVLESPRGTNRELCLNPQKKRNADDFSLCKVENKDNQVGEALGSETPGDDEQDVCLTRKKSKKKRKRQTDKNNKNMLDSESGCQHVSDASDTKRLKLENTVPAISGLSLVSSEKIKEVLSDCGNIDSINNDLSLTNHSNKTSVSKKKRKKNKKKCTSDEANASDNLSTLDPSANSAGNISKEATESSKDAVHNQSAASPGTGQIMQPSKKLLILDLNGLLVDIVCGLLPRGCLVDKKIGKKSLIKRPFCDEFVKFCFETFNVGVWSSRNKINVDKVVDFIMGEYKHKLLFCWDQSHCTHTGFKTIGNTRKPMVFKEIKKVWNAPWNKGGFNRSNKGVFNRSNKGVFNHSNTLLLDDSPYKALLNPPHTAVFPDTYKCWNAKDDALGGGGKLREYLEGIAKAEHVQKYVEQNPFGQRAITSRTTNTWAYYERIIKLKRFSVAT